MAKKEKIKKPFYKKWWVWVLAVIIVSAIASGGEEETAKPASTTAKTETNSETTEKPAKKEIKKEEKKQFTVGQEVKVGKFSYIVKGVEETNKISNVLGDKTTDGKFAIVELSVKNGDKKARMADSSMFKIKTADGTEYEADAELDMYVNDGGIGFFLEDINPNISKTGKVVFELPTEAKEYNLEVSSGAGWSGGKYEQIKLK
jgi:Domain of unknown function (DUF4352)